jgi:hypothetical protein
MATGITNVNEGVLLNMKVERAHIIIFVFA